MTDRCNLLAYHPFARLNRLLAGVAPGRPGIARPGAEADAPLALSVGEPQGQPPALVAEALAEATADWSRYPPARGTPAYLAAVAAWLERRYRLPAGMIATERMILPLPGSREGLFFTALACVPVAERREEAPIILIPSPGYHVYAGAVAAAGAEAHFVAATPESGGLPAVEALPEAILARTALCYYNTPANPQGTAAGRETLKRLIELARRHDFIVAFDECYSEIYPDAPPAGALEAVAELGGDFSKALVFNSLSKRSSAPGLRCGFVVGDPAAIDALDGALRVGGAGVPLPVLAAGARLWQDEGHVEANRALYQENFAVAERILGNRFGFRRPAGGFFLWLDVGDGEAAARRLWAEAGLRVLPGAYMCGPDADGRNPGAPFIRVALVYEPAVTAAALERLAAVI